LGIQLSWESGQKYSRGKGLETGFSEHYASLGDGELLHIAGDRKDLREEAAVALDAEMARRGLTRQHARAKKRQDLRLDIAEARAHRSKHKSKYFEYHLNLRAFFIGSVGFVPLMLFAADHRRFGDEWFLSAWVVYLGILLACVAVQSWVRRTVSFWFCLAISCVPQFLVSHWLIVYHPSQSESKGSMFLSLFAGYALGGSLFVLLQKIKPGRNAKDAQ
jgi:hypothetical protein